MALKFLRNYCSLRDSRWAEISVFLMGITDCTHTHRSGAAVSTWSSINHSTQTLIGRHAPSWLKLSWCDQLQHQGMTLCQPEFGFWRDWRRCRRRQLWTLCLIVRLLVFFFWCCRLFLLTSPLHSDKRSQISPLPTICPRNWKQDVYSCSWEDFTSTLTETSRSLWRLSTKALHHCSTLPMTHTHCTVAWQGLQWPKPPVSTSRWLSCIFGNT